MTQKWFKIAAVITCLGAGITIGTQLPSVVNGDGVELTPGSVDDPVVTKSYVDEQIASKLGAANPTPDPVAAPTLEVVTVPAGQTLMASAGAEVIIRVGKAVAYSSDASGISDVTDGKDLTKGMAVPTNHLLWFPRDGRGITPDPAQQKGLTVVIRGSYTLTAAQ